MTKISAEINRANNKCCGKEGKVNILGGYIDRVSMDEAVVRIKKFIDSRRPHHIITLNAEILYRAQREKNLLHIINCADLVTADGAGIVWAGKYAGKPLPERVTGIDLMVRLLEEAQLHQWKVFLFGAAPEVVRQAAEKIKGKYPQIEICGTKSGYYTSIDEEKIIEEIRASQADLLFVALGAPKQEYWIYRHLAQLDVPAVIGVGGSFDVISGTVKRAPGIFQKLQAEWLYRLIKEPWRWKRMTALPKFVLEVVIHHKKN